MCSEWINRCDVYTAFKTRKECICPDLGHSSMQALGTRAYHTGSCVFVTLQEMFDHKK